MLQQEERERAEGSWFVSKAYYDNDWLTFEMHICLFFMALEVLPAFVRTLLKGIWIFFFSHCCLFCWFIACLCWAELRHVLLELFLTAFKWITTLNQLPLIRCKDFIIIILFIPNPSLLASEDNLSCYNWLNRNKVVVNKFVVGSAKVSPEIVQNDLLKTDTSHQNNLKVFFTLLYHFNHVYQF